MMKTLLRSLRFSPYLVFINLKTVFNYISHYRNIPWHLSSIIDIFTFVVLKEQIQEVFDLESNHYLKTNKA